MSQRELEKQLLLQRIAAQRALTRLEVESLRLSFSPLRQLSSVPSELAGVMGYAGPLVSGMLRQGFGPRWLRYVITVTLPVAITVLTWKGQRR